MALNNKLVKFSPKDKIKKVKIPNEFTPELANLIGILLGDGNIYIDNKKYENQISCTGHLFDEKEWYLKDIQPPFIDLFNIKPDLYEDKRKNNSSIKLMFRSKAIVTFFTKVIGMTSGKKDKCGIPKILMETSNFRKDFLRGFIDTDFSLSFSKRKPNNIHKHPRITIQTSNTNLAKQVNSLIQLEGFKTYSRYKFQKIRRGKKLNSNEISINGKENLKKWIKEISFSSPKHITKYLIWKKYGFCPPYTTLAQREAILNGDERLIKNYKEKLINS